MGANVFVSINVLLYVFGPFPFLEATHSSYTYTYIQQGWQSVNTFDQKC